MMADMVWVLPQYALSYSALNDNSIARRDFPIQIRQGLSSLSPSLCLLISLFLASFCSGRGIGRGIQDLWKQS